jgi:hypothetical protein
MQKGGKKTLPLINTDGTDSEKEAVSTQQSAVSQKKEDAGKSACATKTR